MTVPLLHHDYGGKAPERVGLSHPSIAPYSGFETSDGRQIVLSIQNEREWALFCEGVLGQAELASDERFVSNTRRVANRPVLDAVISEVFTSMDYAEAVRRLNAARIAYGSLNQVADLSRHPQLRRMTVATQAGPVEAVAPPLQTRGMTFSPRPTPALGQHTDAIRKEFA